MPKVCAYLRDHSTLERLEIYLWNFNRQRQGSRSSTPFMGEDCIALVPTRGAVFYDEKRDMISFSEWIDQLQFSFHPITSTSVSLCNDSIVWADLQLALACAFR